MSSQRKRVPLHGRDSVYRRGRRWFANIEYPRDPKTGARVRKRSEGFKTRREAEAERDRLRNEIRSGVDTVPEKLTVATLLDRYLASRTALSPTTADRYRNLADRVRPHLGAKPTGKVRAVDFASLYADLQTQCRFCTANVEHKTHGKPLSATSVRHLHTLLFAAFGWAVRMNALARNPLTALAQDAPRRAKPKTDAYSDAQVVALLDAVRGTRWEAPLRFALGTGCRRGEVAALRWADVAFEGEERATVTIARAFVQVGTTVTLKTTKTEFERRIPCNALALDALRIARFQQQADAFSAGDGYHESGYVFTDHFGAPLRPRALTRAFQRLARGAGVEGRRLHDARHWVASQMLASGTDVVTTAKVLGHHSTSTTLSVYSHLVAGLAEDAVTRLDARLAAAIARVRAGGAS